MIKSLRSMFLISLSCLLYTGNASAYDFSETNDDGKNLYYDIVGSGNTVSVTYESFTIDEAKGYGYYSNYVAGDLVIPSTVTNDGITYTVSAIRYSAFCDCKDLESIFIPGSKTSINSNSFGNCSGLKAKTLPKS